MTFSVKIFGVLDIPPGIPLALLVSSFAVCICGMASDWEVLIEGNSNKDRERE